jgi:hypothetical protein
MGKFLALFVLLSCFTEISYGNVLFSSLKKTLDVTATHKGGVLKAGKDTITVSWSFNQSLAAGTDSDYKTVKVKLCYAPVSQVDRGWRKTVDNLKKDKTCKFKILAKAYSAGKNTVDWLIERDAPSATYFVRVYAFDAADSELAYGQNTDAKKTTDLFMVQSISGRHASLDTAAISFSVFSIVALFGFFAAEKIKAKRANKK